MGSYEGNTGRTGRKNRHGTTIWSGGFGLFCMFLRVLFFVVFN